MSILNKIRRRLGAGLFHATDMPALCYVHLPKCGGQSLVSALRQIYRGVPHRSTNMGAAITAFNMTYGGDIGDTREREIEWNRYRQSLLILYLETGIPLVYGHHPCGKDILDTFSSTYAFITVLREPVSRFISNYVYDRTGPRKEYFPSELNPEKELEKYLESEEARWMANTQVAMLGGYIKSDHSFEKSLDEAMKNLTQYTAVGFTEELEKFGTKLQDRLGRELQIGRVNTTRKWENQDSRRFNYKSLFTDAVRDRIREISKTEYTLYERAHDLSNACC